MSESNAPLPRNRLEALNRVQPGVDLKNIKYGTSLTVSFGRIGTQAAVVTRIGRHGEIFVKKWRVNSGRWTSEVRIYPVEILEIRGNRRIPSN